MQKRDAFGHRQWAAASPSTSKRTIILVYTLILLTLLFSFLVFIFTVVSNRIYKDHLVKVDGLHRISDYATMDFDAVYVGYIVLRFKSTPLNIMLGVGWVAGTLACLSGLAFWELRNTKRWQSAPSRIRTWIWVNVLSNVLNFGVVVACLAIVFAQHHSTGNLVISRSDDDGRHYIEVTRESFVCGMKDIEGWDGNWANVGCGFAMAGRWLMIPLTVCSAGLLVVCLYQVWRWHFTRRVAA